MSAVPPTSQPANAPAPPPAQQQPPAPPAPPPQQQQQAQQQAPVSTTVFGVGTAVDSSS